jgi:hypothetical protein
MTSIEISGAREDLAEISSQLSEVFKKDGLRGRISLTETRFDSVDAGITAILQVTFSGVIAIVQVINLILKLQENRQEFTSEEKTPISIIIEAGNGRKIEFKASDKMTNEEINNCLNTFLQRFSNELLEPQERKLFRTTTDGITSLDIAQINSLFESLLTKTQRIRERRSTVVENENGLTVKVEMIETILIDILRKEGNQLSFYLPIQDIELCQDIFFAFEIANILYFQEISHDIKMLDMQNVFVKYEVEKLMLFEKIIQNQEFKFYASFNSSN